MSTHPIAAISALPPTGRGSPAHAVAASAGTLLAAAFTAWPQQWVVLLVVAPWLEEIVFRIGLHASLLARGADTPRHRLAANLLTAVAFAAAHMVWRADLSAGLTLLPAVLVGCVYQRWRQLLPCVAMHALFNGLWLLWAGLPAPF